MLGFFRVSPEAWHLAELVLLFLTQAAMEMESRAMLALLLLSLRLREGLVDSFAFSRLA